MSRALALAERGVGRTSPNPPVGAVVVRNGRMVGEGFHRRAGTDHAEVVALRQAGRRADGADLFVTLEPCSTFGRTPPCTSAIIEAGIRRVVAAVRDPNPSHRGRGFRILKKHGIAVEEGTGADRAMELLSPFRKWIRTGRPYLTLKLAMSTDGRIADSRGRSKWITGRLARSFVKRARARADAVMVGIDTVIADNPSLLPVLRPSRDFLRVVVDSRGRIPTTSRILNDRFSTSTIVASTRLCDRSNELRIAANGAAVWRLPARRGRVSLKSLLRRLGRQGSLHVLCEGGGGLAAGLIGEGLVDEYWFLFSPRLIGGSKAVPSVGGPGWSLGRCQRLRFLDVRRMGGDLFIRARPA